MKGSGSSLPQTFQRKPQVINQLPSKAQIFRAGSCFLFEIRDILKSILVKISFDCEVQNHMCQCSVIR